MKDLFSLYCLSLHFYLPFTAGFRTVVFYKLFIYLLVRYMYCIWLNVKTEVHVLKVKWYKKAYMQQTFANCNRDSNLKKELLKSEFQKSCIKRILHCMCMCLGQSCFRTASFDQNSYLLPRFVLYSCIFFTIK